MGSHWIWFLSYKKKISTDEETAFNRREREMGSGFHSRIVKKDSKWKRKKMFFFPSLSINYLRSWERKSDNCLRRNEQKRNIKRGGAGCWCIFVQLYLILWNRDTTKEIFAHIYTRKLLLLGFKYYIIEWLIIARYSIWGIG